jgi:cysteine-rich repeat protein
MARRAALVLLTIAVMPVRAAVDMTALWHVVATGVVTAEADWDIVQSGTTLTVSRFGNPIGSGTIDPDTGAFSMAFPSSGGCDPGAANGTVEASGTRFTATYFEYTIVYPGVCTRFDYDLVGTLCGNGQLDAGEVCDDHNVADGDCCSSTCQLDAPGTPCPDANDCTDDTCDGSGICIHTIVGGPCDDGIFCNGSDTCDNGACSIHSGDPCLGGPECADTCNESVKVCEGPIGSPCQDDGSSCTLDYCANFGATAYCNHQPFYFGQRRGCAPCEACDASGQCAERPLHPASGACKGPAALGGGRLAVLNRTPDDGDRLKWRLASKATTPAELGDPTLTDDYVLCVYDESSPTPQLLLRVDAPADGICGTRPCWLGRGTPPGNAGYTYTDRAGTSDGLVSLRVTPGGDGKAKESASAKGSGLALPPPASLPLPLRVQLQAENGSCWESTFSNALVNDGTKFKARTTN